MDDCLAMTGADSSLTLVAMVGLGLVIAGVVTATVVRIRGSRTAGIGAALVALLLLSGVVMAPASPAVAASLGEVCAEDGLGAGAGNLIPNPSPTPTVTPSPTPTITATPVELTPVFSATPNIVTNQATVEFTGRVFNFAPAAASGTPVVLRVTKLPEMSDFALVSSPPAIVDLVSDPNNYIITVTEPIPASGFITITFSTLITVSPTSLRDADVFISLDAGTGNDTRSDNNTDRERLALNRN